MSGKYPIYDVSLKIARQRMFLAGLTDNPAATEEDIARVMQQRGIGPEDVQAIYHLVGADGVLAVRRILSDPT